jgi:ADP-L-glycero-D-manno-heptose 6-epimerase
MYLVTGGAGFIGSNLVAALTARGAEVMIVDRLREGTPGREKWRNLAKHKIAGILPPEEIEDFWDDAGEIDAVLHMGAISATTATDGDLVAATNITLPLWLWSACAERGVPLIYASSAATYGDGAQGFDDSMEASALSALRPLNLYGWSKLAFDRRVADMLGRGTPGPPQWAGLRFFNVYGPRTEYHKGRMPRRVPQVQRSLGGGRRRCSAPTAPASRWRQKRDFVHVDDCVAVMLWLLETRRPRACSTSAPAGGAASSTWCGHVRRVGGGSGHRVRRHAADLRGKYQYFTERRWRLRAAGFERQSTR